jgi:2-haloacid dehalogenase
MTREVSALVFDAYGTIFDVHSVTALAESFFPGRGTALSAAWRGKQLEYTWQRSLMQRYAPFSQVTREALEYACSFLHLAFDSPKEKALMEEYLRLAPFADVPAALKKLKGRKLAILTNGSPDMIAPLVEHSGLAFDAVLSVDEVGVFKPAPEVYQLAVEALRVKKEDIGFVSSNCWDAIGAKSFGFSVYWINRANAPVDRTGFAPDAQLASLGDLPGMLR